MVKRGKNKVALGVQRSVTQLSFITYNPKDCTMANNNPGFLRFLGARGSPFPKEFQTLPSLFELWTSELKIISPILGLIDAAVYFRCPSRLPHVAIYRPDCTCP
jgi:hypothetical protein